MKSKFKRVFASMLVVLMLVTAAPLEGMAGIEWTLFSNVFSAKAEAADGNDYYTSGYCGEVTSTNDGTNMSWSITDDGILTVEGTGRMAAEAFNYDLRVKKAIIGEGVENIADYAFNRCINLTEIVIPETVTEIGSHAFMNCVNLPSVNTANVTVIGDYGFCSCTNLLSIEMPKVEKICQDAFLECFKLTDVLMPEVTEIGSSAFYSCYKIQSADMPKLTTIGLRAFQYCQSLTTVTMPNVTSIGENAFFNCKLGNVDLPNIVTIGAYAFCQSGVQSISAQKVETIGNKAFYACSELKKIEMPNLITVGAEAFDGCSISDATMPKVEKIGVEAFYGCSLTELNLPNVTEMGKQAFANNKNLNVVSIGSSLSVLNTDVFSNCKNLSRIDVSQENTAYSSRDGIVYDKAGTKIVFVPNGIEGEITLPASFATFSYLPFASCEKLTAINIEEGNANYASVDGIVYTSDMTEITFVPAGREREVTVPATVKRFDSRAFDYCKKLSSIGVEEDSNYFTSVDGIVYRKDKTSLYLCPLGKQGDIVVDEATTTIEQSAFYKCLGITSVVMPNVITVGYNAFAYCSGIKSVEMPKVTEVRSSAFDWCNKLETVIMPSATIIGHHAFEGCSVLTAVKILNVEEIGSQAFRSSGLVKVELPNIKTIGSEAFGSCKNLEEIFIGSDLTELDSKAFAGSEKLAKIVISEDNAAYCTVSGIVYNKEKTQMILIPNALSGEITIPEEFEGFEYSVFESYKNLTAVNLEGNSNYTSSDGIIYSADKSILLFCPRGRQKTVVVDSAATEIGDSAFERCSVQTVDTSNAVLINQCAFHISSLKSIKLRKVTTIGYRAFDNCSCKSVEMPEVTTIDSRAFYNCGIEKADMPKVKTIGQEAFNGCDELITVSMPVVEQIGPEAFTNSGLVELTLPRSLKTMDRIRLKSLKVLTFENPYFKFTSPYAPVTAPDCLVRAECGTFGHTMATKEMLGFESLKHTMLSWYTVTPATYESDGLEKRDCAYCPYSEERVIPMLQKDKYTATFVADGKVVSKVEFPKNAVSIEEPEVPAKDRHSGKWEDYVLTNFDITINAKYSVIKSDNASDIITESTAEYYEDTDDVLFTLTATSPSKVVKSSVSKSVPLDIVLVVDQSGSMDQTLGEELTKVASLKNNAKTFISNVFENAKLTGANHRISIVGFGIAGDYKGFSKNENTELLTGNRGAVSFDQIKTTDYASSLLNVNVSNEVNPLLLEAVSNIEARGATAADLGLEMAKGVFANIDSTDRERVVVFMTDGEPTYSSGFQREVANSAIANASVLKNAYNATVFSVGILSDSQSSSQNINTFMNAVSSNYPNATSMMSTGSKADGEYYTTVNNTDNLSSVFKTISTEALSHTAPFDDLAIIKTLSKYVTLTSQQEQALRVNLVRKYGISNNDIRIARNEDGTTTIRIDNLKPEEMIDENGETIYQVKVEFFASLNEKASEMGKYIVDTEDSGVMLGSDANLYEVTFETSEVETNSTKARVIFAINNEVYEIIEGTSGSAVVAPDFTVSSGSTFSGWKTDGVKVANGIVLNAILVKAYRSIIWHTSGGNITQTYLEGEFIVPPAVDCNETGVAFLSWDSSIPTVMPDKNLEFSAVYGEHVHMYTSEITKQATCELNGITTYTCACGETYDETINALGHNYEAITSSVDIKDSKCTFVCQNCGDRYDYALDYQVVSKTGRNKKVVYEFSLTDDNLNLGFEPDGKVVIKIPLTDFQSNAKSVTVVRTNDDGSKTTVPSVIEDEFVVITADHFTPYEVNFDIECAEHSASDWIIDSEATCSQAGSKHKECVDCCMILEREEISKLNHDYKEDITEATCDKTGMIVYTCRACGYTYSKELSSLAHTEVTIKGTPATCTSAGLTDGTKCSVCGKTIKAQETIPALGHIDADGNGACDRCGETVSIPEPTDPSANCSHICHTKNGFVRFFYKIALFFWKLFKINKYCSCGAAHY